MTQVATTNKPATLKAILSSDRVREQLAIALPKHLSQERFTRVALTALSRTPALRGCDQTSFFNALLELSSLGLEPDNRKAYLIPFKNNRQGITECQLIVSYVGLQELVRRSGEVKEMHSDLVCENDKLRRGLKNGKMRFDWEPANGERGKVIGAFSVVVTKSDGVEWEYMTTEQINEIRDQSRGKGQAPWTKHWNEMARKTVFRRHAKRLPFSVEVQENLDKESAVDFGKDAIDIESTTDEIDPFKETDEAAQEPEPTTEAAPTPTLAPEEKAPEATEQPEPGKLL